jgi:2-polyprenyl-3-methyl-5-hydroxy-6-metoxy-1,4-benzoquinol methylase
VFLKTGGNRESTEKFYQKAYREVDTLPKKTAEEMFNDPAVQQDCKDRIAWLHARYGDLSGANVLEIGSSSGYFLDVLSSAGAEVVGVELNKAYGNYARSLGFDVYSKPVENLFLEDDFDLVVMFHTLEHVCDPMSVVQAVQSALVEGGSFMGEVPNQYDWRIKIFDNEAVKRFHYDPNHYYYFSPGTLKNYLKKYGFEEVSFETVERYNSLIQLRRILCGEYDQDNIDEVLKRDVFAKPAHDVRLRRAERRHETMFNNMFEECVNSELMGNCLRWSART